MALLPSAGRRRLTLALAALGLVIVLGALGVFIARSQQEGRSRVISNFKLRGSASATLVSTYIAQQAERQRITAEHLMSGALVGASRFRTVTDAFGAQGAVLLDHRGVVLNVTPARAGRIGESLLNAYSATREALAGRTSVSDVLPGPNGLASIVTVGVPYGSGARRRVFTAAYATSGAELTAFVDHAIAYPQHRVMLIDRRGSLLAASPRTSASSIWGADLSLASAIEHAGTGQVPGQASTFTTAPVPGTPWRIVLAVPDSKLYATVSGTATAISWLVFALVSVLAVGLLALFARSLADRSRLAALSQELESIARTDPLTGLANRRGIEEDAARAFARARRRGEPMTVLMIDLDRFKEVNDRHGHDAGDRVLVALADCMRDALRAEDVYGRLGGDEFVVLMDGRSEDAGRATAERLRERTRAVDLSDLGLAEGVPMSIGMACGVHVSPEDLMRRADIELYRVKHARAGVGVGAAPPAAWAERAEHGVI